MNNSTDQITVDLGPVLYFQTTSFTIIGLIAIIGNILIILVILGSKTLRGKEFDLLLALAVADVLTGIVFAGNGIRRFWLIAKGAINYRVSSWRCLNEFPMLLAPFGPGCAGLMIAAIAFDRMLAIIAYKWYRNLSSTYSYLLISLAYGHSLISTAVGIYTTYELPRIEMFPLMCILSFALSDTYIIYEENTDLTSSLLSILFYVVTVLGLRYQTFQTSGGENTMQTDAGRKRQLQVTRTVGVIVIITASCITVPTIVRILLVLHEDGPKWQPILFPLISILTPLNSAVNIFVYAWKYEKFGQALAKMFNLRKKTMDISLTVPTAQNLLALPGRRTVTSEPNQSFRSPRTYSRDDGTATVGIPEIST